MEKPLLKYLPLLFSAFSLSCNEWTHLHYNENSRPPFESVSKAMMEALNESNRYPDAEVDALINQIAKYHSVNPDQILLNNGLTGILRIIAETFSGPGKELISPTPGYEYLNLYAEVRGAKVVRVPLRTSDYAHDLERTLKEITPSTQLIYICNPNNPTGSLTPRAEIERFIENLPPHIYVFIDEAYHHYVNDPDYISFLDKPIQNDSVMVGRTFSKVYSFAGMRLGYLIGASSTIKKLQMNNCINHNNIVALRGGSAALKDEDGLNEVIRENVEAREEFCRQLNKRKIGYIKSHANFVMMETDGHSVEELITHFEKHKIRIGRKFMQTHVRISLGLPSEMKLFWKVWDCKL